MIISSRALAYGRYWESATVLGRTLFATTVSAFWGKH